MPWDENDSEGKRRYSAFAQALADLGWNDGRNVRLDIRWAGSDIDRIRELAQELVALQPDVILAFTTPVTATLQRETRAIPIVILTSSAEQRDLIEGYRLGANAYIQKPVDFDQFRKTIKTVGLYWLVINQPPVPEGAIQPQAKAAAGQ